MDSWTIYGKNGVAKAEVHELELHDEWMAECYLTITVKSAEPIDFAVDDYIDYRGERYAIQYDPTLLKKARANSYGEGFIYDNIKFVNEAQAKIVRCDFNDIVLNDNELHYTSLPTFPFYCESVDDLLDRILANLEDLYPGEFTIIGLNTVRNKQRAEITHNTRYEDEYKKWIDPTLTPNTEPYGKQGVAETVDNINCWNALAKVHEDFELNFIVRGYTIIVGTVGVFTANKFRYGKGNGLYEIERISDSEQQIVTRLRSYGASTNLPSRYYATLNTLVFGTITKLEGNEDYASFTLDLSFSTKYFNYRSESYPGTVEYPNYIVRMRVGEHTIRGYVTKDYNTNACSIYCEGVNQQEDDRDEPNIEELHAFIQSLAVGTRVYFVSYVEKAAFDPAHTDYATTNLPDNMAVSRLMLPGFPNQSLYEWAKAHRDEDTPYDDTKGICTINGFTAVFSKDKYRPYIDSPNTEDYGIRPASFYFDGSGDNDDIHPTIEGMTYNGQPIDVIYAADAITDNGVYAEGKEPDPMYITLPPLGFELDQYWTDEASIEMKDGMCGGRSLKIVSKPKKIDGGYWQCKVNRVKDDSLELWFPYNDFQIRGGDHYVLVGIDMPDEYVSAASERLFYASIEALQENHAPRFTFQPRIDELWMQRQHDSHLANPAITSLHDTLKSGDIFSFADTDMAIDANIIIDVLTIKENGNNGIPTYEVTLRDEKQVSPIQKIQNKVNTLTSSNLNGGGNGGGGISGSQMQSLIEQDGNSYFLSKLNDDEASGVITFLKGIWIGTKKWAIDALGNANLNSISAEGDVAVGGDATINGTLRGNEIQSDNYTGDGVADTGYRLTKDDGTGSSKLTVDNLYVRKKATFEELEVRKETAIAGNQIYSSAANIILRTDYFDANGQLMGYSTVQVPWMLKGTPFLLRMLSRASRTGFFGRQRKIRMFLEEEDIPNIRRVRCYFLAKDDERTIDNLWQCNENGADLARCQTMNLHNSQRSTYIHGLETKLGNVYWWRKLCGVSSQPVTLDDGKEYHYIDVMFDYNAEEQYRQQGQQCPWADVASGDIPCAGDHVVQFGNDTNPDRMNLIAVEVNSSSDAPAHKWYRGIYTFDLGLCWWGGNPRKAMISAASGIEFYGPSFKIDTEYGTARVPKDRPEVNWSDISTQRDDYGEHLSVRKCYSYDAITHGGCRWLCLLPDGAHWVRQQQWDSDAYKLFDANKQYRHNGNYITDLEYSALTTDQKKQCGRIPNYTTTEPGTAAAEGVWRKIVDKGANSIRIDLDNENDTMLYSSTKGLVSGNVYSHGSLMDGTTDVTAAATWSIVAAGCTATISGSTVTVTAMSASTGSVMVRATYNGHTYEKELTLKKIVDGDKFELIITPNSIAYNITSDSPATSTLSIQVWKTACDGTRALSAPPSGYNVYANGNKLTASSTGTYSYNTDNSEINEVLVKIATSSSATDSLDAETIPVNKAANGAHAVRIDLDNENDAMLYSSSKGLVSGNVTSTARLYDGTSDVSESATWSITNSNCTATISNRVITVTAMSAATGSVTVSAQYNGKTYTAILTLKKILDADKYDLVITPNSIPYNSTTDTPATSTLAIQVWKTACDGTRALSAPPSGYKVFANGNALTASSTGTYSYTTDNSAISEVTVKIATSASATDSLDAETIPVNKAANGASITKKSETYRYATNNTGTRPAASSSDWKATKPTLQKGYWLYTETTITWSDNSKTVLYTDERNPNDGVAGQDIIVDGSTIMKYYVGDSNTTHPAEDSSDWKDLNQVTQTQGKWLWSQATTWYRKSSSASGAHDGGKSVNYNVSYISKDGKTGRGISSITEYYQATNSSAARTAPTSATGWSTDPNLSDLTDKWDQNHKYLWNMERTIYANVDGTTTTTYSIPQIVAIWTKDGSTGSAGRGIDSIVNYYKVTSTSTAPSKPSTPGTGGWSTTPSSPTKGQYLWNYERITWINPAGTTETDVQMIGYSGTDGASITKASADTFRYAVGDSGINPPSSGWSTTKPSSFDKNKWLWTETTIHWSDGSTTVLYSAERNPNDGVAGQDIIVDGATVMKYYVGDSNTTHPADTSSDWKDLSQVTQTQGKWLWSQATTYYRKASSAAGSHDAGTSYNYNVSYISKDGKTGRGISSITEYYQATNSSAARTAPTSATGWSTDPNLSDLTDKWDQNHKYLWNMERTIYANVDGTTTTTYSIPQIVAIWTKDGAAGKGIDSIVNYYKITSTATAPSKPSTPGTDGWSTTPGALAKGQYLWNYERITWINPSSTTETDVQMIGYSGTDGQNSTVPGPKGDDGDDGWTIIVNPANVILTQSLSTSSNFSTADVSFSAKKGSRTATVSNLTDISEYHFDVTKTGNSSIRVNYPKSSGSSYYTDGYFEVTVHCTDPDTSRDVEFTVRVLCYANLLGSWKRTVEADEENIAASKVIYAMGASGSTLDAIRTDYTSKRNSVGSYETWSSASESTDGSKANMIKKTTTAQSTADGVKTTVQNITTTHEGQTVVTEAACVLAANSIKQWVRDELGDTGIYINGQTAEDPHTIILQADNVKFRSTDGTVDNKFKINPNGTLYAANGGTIGGFLIGDTYLGDTNALDEVGTYISTVGNVWLTSNSDWGALRVIGGGTIEGTGSDNKAVNLKNNYGPVNIGGNTVNIGGSNTSAVNINGSAANFGSSTPVSVGSSLEVQGPFVLGGDTTFITNNRRTAKTVALPSNASRGQVIFAKGTVGDLTLTGAIRNDEGSIVTSIGGDRRSRIFIYGDSYWNEFYCS